jgi:hypothetical protein
MPGHGHESAIHDDLNRLTQRERVLGAKDYRLAVVGKNGRTRVGPAVRSRNRELAAGDAVRSKGLALPDRDCGGGCDVLGTGKR